MHVSFISELLVKTIEMPERDEGWNDHGTAAQSFPYLLSSVVLAVRSGPRWRPAP